jgi:hypothetical protein
MGKRDAIGRKTTERRVEEEKEDSSLQGDKEGKRYDV